jgi:sirohydrochlorin ferrochelatase
VLLNHGRVVEEDVPALLHRAAHRTDAPIPRRYANSLFPNPRRVPA